MTDTTFPKHPNGQNGPVSKGSFILIGASSNGKMYVLPKSLVPQPTATELRELAQDNPKDLGDRLLIVADALDKKISTTAPNWMANTGSFSTKRLAAAWNVSDRATSEYIKLFRWGGVEALREIRRSREMIEHGYPPGALVPEFAFVEFCDPALKQIEDDMRAEAQTASADTAASLLKHADNLAVARRIAFGELRDRAADFEEKRLSNKTS